MSERAAEHTTAIDFEGLLPDGAGQNAKATQLLKCAMRSPDRFIQVGPKKVKQAQKRIRVSAFGATDDTDAAEQDADVAHMKQAQTKLASKKNMALIAQLTNAKQAQEKFEIERAEAKAKKDALEEIEKMKRGKEEAHRAWIRRTHADLYYHAGRGDLIQLTKMWNTIPRKIVLNILDTAIDEDNLETVLLWSAERGRVSIVQWLVHRRCDVYAKDNHGANAVLKACRNAHFGMVKYLTDTYKFAPRLQHDNYGNTMLIESICSGRCDFFEFLHRHFKLDLEQTNELHESPFHLASATGNIEMLKYMLENSVDPGTRGYDNKNAAHYAAMGNHIKVLEFLHEHCPEIDFRAEDRFGHSVVYLAENENSDATQAAKTVSCLRKLLGKRR